MATQRGRWQGDDTLIRRALFIQTLVAAMLGEPLDPGTRAALDRAVIGTYAQRWITNDPRTWKRPAPLLADLTAHLGKAADPEGAVLAGRLAPYVTGSYRGLFAGPTTTPRMGI